MKFFMENKITKEKILIITTILVVSIVFIGIGYAFFTANNPKGSTAQIISKSGRMLINYNDGTDNIVPVTDIQPSNNILVDKTFTLTGINTTPVDDVLTMPFTISLEYQNTFQNEELVYFIKRMDTNENISCTLKGVAVVTDAMISYLNLPTSLIDYTGGTISDASGNTISQILAYGYFKPSTSDQVLTLNLKLMFRDTGDNQDYNKGATFNGKIVVSESKDVKSLKFGTDTWEEIANNVKSGNASKYRVGSEKEVEIGGKSYIVRVANNTTPTECSGTDFSQTACGFVVEFVDIVEGRQMNSTATNVGGWNGSKMRTYANGDFYESLPDDLKNVIIKTKVISGHGSTSGENENFVAPEDKIYLLSPHEVWADKIIEEDIELDTAYGQTRQLDYYAENRVTTSENYSYAIKKGINGNNSGWWLRAAYYSSFNISFLNVNVDGGWCSGGASNTVGFAPAFRIG